MLAGGLDVVVRGEEHGRKHARAKVGAEVSGPGDQVLLVDAEDLALSNDDLHVEIAGQRPHAAFLELRAEPAKHVERGVHGLLDVLRGRDVILPVMAQNADPEPPQILSERLPVPRNRSTQAARVLRVVAGQGLQHQRAVLHRPAERPAVVERVGVGDHAGATHQTERGHQAGDTAERRRAPDRSSGIGAERHRDQAGRDGGSRACGGAAREVREVPGVARGRPRQIERRPRVRHLVGGQLPEQHGAGLVELRGRGSVLGGDPVDEDARVRGGQDASRIVDVLEGEGDSVQGSTRPARGDLGLGLLGLAPRQIERARDEGARLAVVLLDALDHRLDQLRGRELSRGDQAPELGDREVVQVASHGVLPPLPGRFSSHSAPILHRQPCTVKAMRRPRR